MKRIVQRESVPARSKAAAEQGPATVRRAAHAPNHRGTGPLDVARVVEQARGTPRTTSPIVDRVARALGLSPAALEVHSGGDARDACEQLGARAFAVQNVVVFRDPSPSLRQVRHELSHVIQQGGERSIAPSRYDEGSLSLSDPTSRAEREAASVARGASAAGLGGTGVQVCREDGETGEADDESETPDTPETAAEAPAKFATARRRLAALANKLKVKDVDKEKTLFGISNGKEGDDEEFDPVFVESVASDGKDKPSTWKLADYQQAAGESENKTIKTDAARQDLTRRIFKRTSQNRLADDAVARTAFAASGKVVWAVRVIAKGVSGAADPSIVTTSYTFVGAYYTEGPPAAAGAPPTPGVKTTPQVGDAVPYELVNDKVGKRRKKPDPNTSLAAYANVVANIVKVADGNKLDGDTRKTAVAKAVPLTGVTDLKDAITEAQKDEYAEQREAKAKEIRDKLQVWVLDNYTAVEELYQHIIKAPVFPSQYNAIKGAIFVSYVQKVSTASGGATVSTSQIVFGVKQGLKVVPSGKLMALRRGDGVIAATDGNHILEGKARTEEPSPEEIDQMADYKIIIKDKMPGYIVRDGLVVDELEFTAVEYYVGQDIEIAKLWEKELSDRFEKQAPPLKSGYRIHPNPSLDPAKDTTIQLNPLITLPIPKPEQLDQSLEGVAAKQPGVTIKKADFKLARPREAEIASGTIVIAIDMKGPVKSPDDPAPKKIIGVPATEAKPAKPGGPLVSGRVDNDFKKLGSALDKFLKERVTTDAQLTDTGIEAWIRVSAGPSGIPKVQLEEAEVRASLDAKGNVKVSGKLGLSNEKKTIKSDISVSWEKAGLIVAGGVTFSDIVDGLKPIAAKFKYDSAADTTRIWAEQVDIEKKFGAITLKGKATNLELDVNAGEFGGNAAITADLGAFGEATAKATIAKNQIAGAELEYTTPVLKYPKASPVVAGTLSGKVTYIAPKTPDAAATFSGGIKVDAEITASALKKLAKGGKLGIAGQVDIAETGEYSGSLETTNALELGTHFRIPPFKGTVERDGEMRLAFALEVVNVGPLKDAKVDCVVDRQGFTFTGANIQVAFGTDKDKVWGSLGVVYKSGTGQTSGFTVSGDINVRIKEGLVAKGTATYNTQKDEVDASLETGEISLLKYGPKHHKIFGIDKQIEFFNFYHLIGAYFDVGFELGFEYLFDLRLKPRIALKGLSLKDFSFTSASAVMKLYGQMTASLAGTPKIGLGIYVLHTALLRGSGGIKVPVVGTALLKLDPPITVEVTYTPDGSIGAGGTAGLTLLFGVTASLNAYAELVVLDGAYQPTWEEPLTSFPLLKERPIFTYVVDFGQPLTTETNPKLPAGKDTPPKAAASKKFEGKPEGGDVTGPRVKTPVQEGKVEDKPKPDNEGGFDLIGLVGKLFDGPNFKPVKKILDAAADVYKAISDFLGAVGKWIGRIVNFVKNWVGSVIDTVSSVLKDMAAAFRGGKTLFGYLKDFLKGRINPTLFYIIEPLLDQLITVEQDVWDLLSTTLPTSFSGVLSWSVSLIKKVLKLGWDTLTGFVSALWEMLGRIKTATAKFLDYLVHAGRLGVRRHARYVGVEGVVEYDFLMADEYKVIDVGGLNLGPTEDNSKWPNPEKAIGFGIYEVLRHLDVPATDTTINSDTGDPYNNYWVEKIERLERGHPNKHARTSRHDMRYVRDAKDAGDATPLPQPVRERYESAFGTNLGDVRVHTGPASARAADALDARAYTTGRHIHFGAGEYSPHTVDGEHVLSHELAHAAWTPHATWKRYGDHLSKSSDASEHLAEAAAEPISRFTPKPLKR